MPCYTVCFESHNVFFDLDVHVLDQSGSRQYVDSQTMLFIAKWQPLMLAKFANQRIKRSRFHLVGMLESYTLGLRNLIAA